MEAKVKKILLIEDDATMVSLLNTLLSIEGFQVSQVEEYTRDAILETMRCEMPDLALLDVNLREISGLDLIRFVRQDQALKNLRVIMSSGIDYRLDCQAAGADSFIQKPYMPDDLIQKIHQVLGAA